MSPRHKCRPVQPKGVMPKWLRSLDAHPRWRPNPISPHRVLYYQTQLQHSSLPTGMIWVWGYFILSKQVTSAGEESARFFSERSGLHYSRLMSGIERQRIYSAFMVGWIFTAAQTNDNVSSVLTKSWSRHPLTHYTRLNQECGCWLNDSHLFTLRRFC